MLANAATLLRLVRIGAAAVTIYLFGLLLMPFYPATGFFAWGGGRRLLTRRPEDLVWISLAIFVPWAAMFGVAAATQTGASPIAISALAALNILLLATAGKLATSQGVVEPDTVPSRVADLRNVATFRSLSESQLNAVASLGVVRRVPPGWQATPSEGGGDKLFTVLKGEMQLTLAGRHGVAMVDVVGSGETFPLPPLVGCGPPVRIVRGVTGATLWEADMDRVRSLLRRRSDIAASIFDRIAATLGEHYRRASNRSGAAIDQYS